MGGVCAPPGTKCEVRRGRLRLSSPRFVWGLCLRRAKGFRPLQSRYCPRGAKRGRCVTDGEYYSATREGWSCPLGAIGMLGKHVLGIAVFFGATSLAHAAPCLNGLKSALIKGRFSGSVDCAHDQLEIKKVGQLRRGSHKFVIYDYRYSLASICNGCAKHGGQRILLFDDRRYMGQYKSEYVRLSLQGGRLVIWPDKVPGIRPDPVSVKITRRGFPEKILIAGEIIHFFQ